MNIGTLIRILVVILVLGLIWFLLTLLPLPAIFLLIAKVIIVLIAILWLLQIAGLLSFPKNGA